MLEFLERFEYSNIKDLMEEMHEDYYDMALCYDKVLEKYVVVITPAWQLEIGATVLTSNGCEYIINDFFDAVQIEDPIVSWIDRMETPTIAGKGILKLKEFKYYDK
jgi:hypothetical protein